LAEPAGPSERDAVDVLERVPLLSVRGLSVALNTQSTPVTVVDDVSFDVRSHERLAIVGESGSGKTMTAMAVMRLLDRRTWSIEGDVNFAGNNLAEATPRQLQSVRGSEISYIPQDPTAALNPVFPIGFQLKAVIRSHEKVSRQQAKKRAIEMLASVGIPNPARAYDDYPHHLSGGMRQRCVIAEALICHPSLVIADEPTTSLDVTIQAQIFDLLDRRASEEGLALVLISHDIGIVSGICDRIVTMYAGQLVETGPIRELVTDDRARHPYTKALLGCAPSVHRSAGNTDLYEIAGESPNPGRWPSGCRFAPRCPMALDRCNREAQQLVDVSVASTVRCWRAVDGPSPGYAQVDPELKAADDRG
jgi:peptide/nickel transport system ATP-binding protein